MKIIIPIILIVAAFFIGGKVLCPGPITETHTDTLYVYDTITKTISNDIHHYHVSIDTVTQYDTTFIIPDTAAILANYFTTFKYNRTWTNDSIKISFTDYITQNKILKSTPLKYQILYPQTVVNNTYNLYSSYLYGGITTGLVADYQFVGFNLTYAHSKFFIGVDYNPWNPYYKVGVTGGIKILKFKK